MEFPYQKIFAEGFEIGFQEARQQEIAKITNNLLLTGMSVEQIMKVTGLTREQVEQLSNHDSE